MSPRRASIARACAELGLIFVAPDTSPRGEGVPDDPEGAYDFGLGAGFYVDATQAPWSTNLPHGELRRPRAAGADRRALPGRHGAPGDHGPFDGRPRRADHRRCSNPGRFRAVSAFAPIVAPSQVPWGEKALGGYLGADRAAWREHDAVALIEDGARVAELLVDQGDADQFPRRATEARAAGGGLRRGRRSR